jgi:hypothetical protein
MAQIYWIYEQYYFDPNSGADFRGTDVGDAAQ